MRMGVMPQLLPFWELWASEHLGCHGDLRTFSVLDEEHRMKQVSDHHNGSDVSSSELPLADEGSCSVETETVFDPASMLLSP
ncbi:hypothetical protein CapIbe_006445 [Capra ibex]